MYCHTDSNEVLTGADAGAEAAAIPHNLGGMTHSSELIVYYHYSYAFPT